MKKTFCILLNYRNPKEILPLIESVENCRWSNKEIIIIDNGTNREAVEFFEKRMGKDRVVSTPINLGFAGGMNLGIRRALENGAEFLWLLSKDITVENNCLEELHALWPRLDNPGLIGSITDLNGTDQLYFFKSTIDNQGNATHGNKARTISQVPELKEPFGKSDYINGSCIFTHRSVIEKIGLIPEEYFLYFEDTEWGLRSSRAGLQNYVCYRSRVHHRRSMNEFNRTAEYYCRRNSYMFKKRNGFTKPWTKFLELFRTRKNLLKSQWRGNDRLTEVLKVVESDIRAERLGPGPWR